MGKALTLLAVLGLLIVMASPASALPLTAGDYVGDFHDYSSLYDANGNPIGLPAGHLISPGLWAPASSPFVSGTTQRTMVYVNQLQNQNSGDVLFNSSSPTMITGIMADLKLVQAVSENGGTTFIVDFAPIVAQKNPLYGGMLNIYETSSKKNENLVNDPNGAGNLKTKLPTVAGGSVAIPANGAPNAFGAGYSYPYVTTGTLLLDAELVDLNALQALGVTNNLTPFGAVPFATGAVLRETIELSTGTGHGFGFAHVENGNGDYTSTIGTLDASLIPGYIVGSNGIADIGLEFDLGSPIFDASTGKWKTNSIYGGQGYWPETSKDPVTFGVIPEPITLSLLGLGLSGLLARRRMKAS